MPHFTTIIRWTLRTGLFLLNGSNTYITPNWICILDHTVQVGTKKALVILRVPLDKMKEGVTLTLKDVQVVAIIVKDKWNGEIVNKAVTGIFKKVGFPIQVIRDGGSDLSKGIRELVESVTSPIKITYDLTHLIAKLLKHKYSKDETFITIMKNVSVLRKKILQSFLGYIMPPKERSKARFLNLPEYSYWFSQVFYYLNVINVDTKNGNIIMDYLSWLFDYQEYINNFCSEINILTKIQTLLKNKGISDAIIKEAAFLLDNLNDLKMKNAIISYIKEELEFARRIRTSSIVTSDIIESLFGKYKYHIQPTCMSEISRSILILPCICNEVNEKIVEEAMLNISNKDVDSWSQEEVGKTLLEKRRENFSIPKCRDNIVKISTNNILGQKSAETLLLQEHC